PDIDQIFAPNFELAPIPLIPSDFEELLEMQPIPEIPPNPEFVKEHAQKQPLELSIAQLIKFVEVNSDSVDHSPTHSTLIEIHELIVQAKFDPESDENPELSIELVEKILVLLQEIGYVDPQKALIEFVGKYELNTLFQAIEQLYVVHNYDKFESIKDSNTPTSISNDTLQTIGKMLFALITKIQASPLPSEAR
ncbi:MAG: hypothetical protein ABL927_12620, partial [Bdellovibrionales bacterium]